MIPSKTQIATIALAGLAVLPSLSFAQKATTTTSTGGASTTGSAGTSPGVGTSRNPFPTTNPNNNNTPFPTIQRPVFLSGKVEIEGGMPLPTGVSIVRVCGASTRTVAYTDSKGRFQFEWGRSQGVMQDASDTGSMGGFGSGTGMSSNGMSRRTGFGLDSVDTEMMGCELRASAPGFRSDSVNLAGRQSLDNPDVGTLILHRMGNVEGTSISATSFSAPKDAKKAFDKGMELVHKGKAEEATKNFQKAVDSYPRYADAWYQLGLVRAPSDQQAARDAYARALEADSKLVGPVVELGLMSVRDKNWGQAAQYLDRAVRLDPVDFPQAWFGNAVAQFNLRNLDSAEKNIREAMKLDPKKHNPRAGYLLGLILAEKQDFAGASAQLKEFLQRSPNPKEAEIVQKQLNQLEKLASSPLEGKAEGSPGPRR